MANRPRAIISLFIDITYHVKYERIYIHLSSAKRLLLDAFYSLPFPVSHGSETSIDRMVAEVSA